MSKKIHLISHVHWDPAWYQPLECYRIMLLALIDRLLDTLDACPRYLHFHFDGQVSAIDDYLALRPENLSRIQKHIKDGRLQIGPWYIQPEEFMISGESHIRNLMLGMRRGGALGGVSKVSYLCDMVGHIPQMPQIIRGFGLESFCGWRGVIDGSARTTSEFIWRGPDGSEVFFKALPRGYCTALPDDAEGFAARMQELAAILQPFALSDTILVTCGDDHRAFFESLPDHIAAYNQAYGDLRHVTLEQHIDYVRAHARPLPVHTGELRSTYNSYLLTGILTTRMDVKLRCEALSRDIEGWLEPFCTLAALFGDRPYPRALIDRVWKKQIVNAFHDCIYGASVDAVLEDTLNDYKRAGEITDWLVKDSLCALAAAIDTAQRPCNVTIFNPTLQERQGEAITASLFIEGRLRAGFAAEGPDGKPLPVQLLRAEKTTTYADEAGNHRAQGKPKIGYTYTLALRPPLLPPLGYCNVALTEAAAPTDKKHAETGVLCNEYLEVTIEKTGLLTIRDKQSGQAYRHMHQIEDGGDFGDNYNYSRPKEDILVFNKDVTPQITLLEDGPVQRTYGIVWNMPVPLDRESRTADGQRTTNRIESRVTLRQGSRLLEFETVLHNTAKDHRVRLLFPTGIAAQKAAAGSQFYIAQRPTGVPRQEGFDEKPLGNHPSRHFVDISGPEGGVSLLHRGLPEYFADTNGDLYCTLLRCTGMLSLEGLAERQEAAGPMVATPKSQLPGVHTYEYALYIHGAQPLSQVALCAQRFYAPPRAMAGGASGGTLPLCASFLQCDHADIMLSAYKNAEEGEGTIVRVYNIGAAACTARLTPLNAPKRAFATDLNERQKAPLPIHDGSVELSLKPYEIATILLIC